MYPLEQMLLRSVPYCCAIYNQTRITEQPLRTPSTRKIRIVICSIIKSCSNKSIVVLSHVTYKQGVETHKRTTTTITPEYRGNLLSETPLEQAPSTANTAMWVPCGFVHARPTNSLVGTKILVLQGILIKKNTETYCCHNGEVIKCPTEGLFDFFCVRDY